LLFGLGERTVEHDRFLALAQGGRRRRWHQAGDRAEPTLLRPFLLDHFELGDGLGVFVLRPSADDVFGVVTEESVEHAVTFSFQRTVDYALRRQPASEIDDTVNHVLSQQFIVTAAEKMRAVSERRGVLRRLCAGRAGRHKEK
jgi:hypothetical protein